MEKALYNVISLFDGSGKSDAFLEKELELPRSIIYDWRKERSKSYKKYLPEIAAYFHVSLDWLAGNEQKNKATPEMNPMWPKLYFKKVAKVY